MRQAYSIARAVVADAIRRKVVWVVAVFCALLAIAVPALPSYGVGVVSAVYREVAIALMYSASFVVALVLAATRIPGEVEKRTLFGVLARDIRRWHYVAGTWFGMFLVLGMVIVAFVAATIAIGYFQYGEFMLRLFEAGFAVWLEIGVIMAVAVMMTCRFGAVTSVVAALTFTFIGHGYVALLHLAEGERAPLWLPGLDIFNVINPVAHGGGYNIAYALAMLVAAFAWVGLLLLGGSLMFGGRDL